LLNNRGGERDKVPEKGKKTGRRVFRSKDGSHWFARLNVKRGKGLFRDWYTSHASFLERKYMMVAPGCDG